MPNRNDAAQTRQAQADARLRSRMQADYAAFVFKQKLEKSPRAAHMFALAARLQGETYGRSVEEVVLELAGELPAYWPR